MSRGKFIKVPWAILDEAWAWDCAALGKWVRDQLEADIARRGKRRNYIPRGEWVSILNRYGHRCVYCGRSDLPLQREHHMPLALGGPDDTSNIVPACWPCNRRKGTQHPDGWPIR